jgi:p-hydroxybenzoate 3-monooxygenase
MRTQVGIVGAGPAGLLLSQLLHRQGIESVVLESQTRRHVEERVRAGVLEQGTVDLLKASGVGERLEHEGLVHHGIELRFGGSSHRIALTELTGRSITVYGQQEVVKDLIHAREVTGAPVVFEAADVELAGLDTPRPRITFRRGGAKETLECDLIAGCDGFHGVSRASIPRGVLTEYSRSYPFAWLGILAQAPPTSSELIYAHHERGFALYSMRSPSVTRLYLQCAPGEDLAQWDDARIWAELRERLELPRGWRLAEGPILQKGVTPMRSFVVEPMRHGRLFLAGDAAHIVPPTGAKGLNLAANDVRLLSAAIASFYAGQPEALETYSERALKRVWRAEHFSWWMTSMLHRFDRDDSFHAKLQLAQLEYVTTSRAAATSLAENYVGLGFGQDGTAGQDGRT